MDRHLKLSEVKWHEGRLPVWQCMCTSELARGMGTMQSNPGSMMS